MVQPPGAGRVGVAVGGGGGVTDGINGVFVGVGT